jgi:hypothetical protein
MAGLLDEMRAAQTAQSRGLLSHNPQQRVSGRQVADAMQAMGLLAAPIPVVGDVAGLLGDAAMYAAKPEERTAGNMALTALGALPFVPSVAGKAVRGADKFAEWFSGSKAVDASGAPLRVFHGTAQDFAAFDPAKVGQAMDSGKLGHGFYFSSSPAWASNYADAAGKKAGGGANVMPSYLSLKNPLVLSGKGDVWTKLRAKSAELGVKADPVLDEAMTPNPEWSKAFSEAAKKAGYDGMILDGAGEYVAFSPTQVKSQFNRGTWSKTDPAVLKSVAAAGLLSPALVQSLRDPQEQ